MEPVRAHSDIDNYSRILKDVVFKSKKIVQLKILKKESQKQYSSVLIVLAFQDWL